MIIVFLNAYGVGAGRPAKSRSVKPAAQDSHIGAFESYSVAVIVVNSDVHRLNEHVINDKTGGREEFQDVCILRTVHRVDRGESGAVPTSATVKYAAEADRFLDVTAKMADCTWSLEDHAWLGTTEQE